LHITVVLYKVFYLKNGSCHRPLPHSPGVIRERIAYRS
jgi:hypothetical protein